MKVIFCDIDNVLNSIYRIVKYGENEEIEKLKVKKLKKIIDATGAEVIIVSHANSFFKGTSFPEIRIKLIRQYGVNPIGELDNIVFGGKKESAVKKWIDDNKVDKFVIFDDEADNYVTLLDHLILVEGRHGLTDKHVRKAIEMLNN